MENKKMNKKILAGLLALWMCFANTSLASEAEVMNVVNMLFEAMRESDGEKVASIFTENARLMTVTERDGQPVLLENSITSFIESVGQPHEKVWNEPIWDYRVEIDGNLAQVWTKYAFFLGDDFSHCGVDAFQLFNDGDSWKIFQLVDTRHREGCELPEGL
jgi:hypothetical protein